MPDDAPSALISSIGGITLSKWLFNMARRFPYPFAPALSRGLGVSLTAVTSLIAINQATSLLGILIGPLSDQWGYRRMMLVGIGMLALGMLAAGLFPFYIVVLVALLLAGFGKSIFDPAAQAWAGSRVAYRRRALVIGVMEISWSASTLIGIPLTAVMMDRYGWRSPFIGIGALAIIATIALFFIIPPETHGRPRNTIKGGHFLGMYGRRLCSRPALGALGYAFFVSMANDNLFVVYGAWLEQRFGLGLVTLGLGTSLIGVAELAGEGLTAVIADRAGVRRSVFFGASLSTMGYLLLPWLDNSFSAAMGGLVLLFFTSEFAMVSSFSLCTEILPDARATMMAGFFALAGLGRAGGALLGGIVWQQGGILATGMLSGSLSLLGIFCLMAGLNAWQPKSP